MLGDRDWAAAPVHSTIVIGDHKKSGGLRSFLNVLKLHDGGVPNVNLENGAKLWVKPGHARDRPPIFGLGDLQFKCVASIDGFLADLSACELFLVGSRSWRARIYTPRDHHSNFAELRPSVSHHYKFLPVIDCVTHLFFEVHDEKHGIPAWGWREGFRADHVVRTMHFPLIRPAGSVLKYGVRRKILRCGRKFVFVTTKLDFADRQPKFEARIGIETSRSNSH